MSEGEGVRVCYLVWSYDKHDYEFIQNDNS